ncbi:MAG: hypothetical protein ACM3ZE_00610 [Myxococcales bacterium]
MSDWGSARLRPARLARRDYVSARYVCVRLGFGAITSWTLRLCPIGVRRDYVLVV